LAGQDVLLFDLEESHSHPVKDFDSLEKEAVYDSEDRGKGKISNENILKQLLPKERPFFLSLSKGGDVLRNLGKGLSGQIHENIGKEHGFGHTNGYICPVSGPLCGLDDADAHPEGFRGGGEVEQKADEGREEGTVLKVAEIMADDGEDKLGDMMPLFGQAQFRVDLPSEKGRGGVGRDFISKGSSDPNLKVSVVFFDAKTEGEGER